MLNLRKVLAAKPKEHVKSQLDELLTPWGEQLDQNDVLPEHPTPQFQRDRYRVLNGVWKCAFAPSGHDPAGDVEAVCAQASMPPADRFETDIVVPFSPEAALSGVRRQLQPDELLWYRQTFEAPRLEAGQRCLLHFQAVDYACSCFVNGELVGTHAGAYLPFTFDITDCLQGEGAGPAPVPAQGAQARKAVGWRQAGAAASGHVAADTSSARPSRPVADSTFEIALCVADPSEFGGHVRGKQRFDRGDIWYTAQSGIWQTVWMEVVPTAHVERLQIEPDLATGVVAVGAVVTGAAPETPEASLPFHMRVLDAQGSLVAEAEGVPENGTVAVAAQVANAHPWSPDDPYLYQLVFQYGEDAVNSYCGFRSIEMRRDGAGHRRVFLNGEPLFIRGVLDQAYWSDGLMTAPSDEALVYDIQAMRDEGFNLMRKHIKVESARWYYHCDRMGMLVLQDMVQGGAPEIQTWDWSYKPTLFKFSWDHFDDRKARNQEKLGAGSAAYREEWTITCQGTVRLLGNSPSIIGWSLFNEGWGQFDSRAALNMVRAMDPTRVIDAVSGWYDQGRGDFRSVHNYFRDLSVWKRNRGRAFFVSEFGGFSHRVEGHSSLPECYGYEVYDSRDEWRRAVKNLLEHMNSLDRKGLAGYVYTQVSDIEEETNGILTYDRRVNKFA